MFSKYALSEQAGDWAALPPLPLDKNHLQTLTRVSVPQSLWALLSNWGHIALVVGIFEGTPSPWRWVLLPFLVVYQARNLNGLGILVHEAIHHTLLPWPWLNNFVGRWLCGFPMGLSLNAYQRLHLAHHRLVLDPQDPDYPLYQGLPASPALFWRRILGDTLGGASFQKYWRTLKGDGQGAVNPDMPLMLLFHAAVWGVLIWQGWWLQGLLLWFLPMATVMPVFFRLRAAMEHGAVDGAAFPLKSRTTLGSAWGRFWFSPHHSHFHLEHHWCPGAPHYRLGMLHRLLRDKGALVGAEISPGYTATCKALVHP